MKSRTSKNVSRKNSSSSASKLVKKGFIVEGTTCGSCEKIIKRQALKVDGVKDVSFDLSSEVGYVSFDPDTTNIDLILNSIEERNYSCFILDESEHDTSARSSSDTSKKSGNKLFGTITAVAGIILAIYFITQLSEVFELPQISQNMGYGLLFGVGLLTGFHCVGMCGGFVVSYSAKASAKGKSPHASHALYAIGKTVSYTLIGALFGLLGSFIIFTPAMRGYVGLFAGLFLVLYGLKMLNIFPSLRKVQLKTPKILDRFVAKNSSHRGPLTVGLLNGLMIACGPLQAIYIMAAGTGSFFEGAKLLFIFAVGTLPVMIGFAYIASYLSAKSTHRILKASGVLVIVLGLIMMNNGLVLTGSGYDAGSLTANVVSQSANAQNSPLMVIEDGFQVIEMDVTRYGWEPANFVLQKGVPVRWKITGKEITGCNKAIQVPAYGLEFDIQKGEQIIEFTPTKEGTIRWSCWMGMIPGSFIVKDDLAGSDMATIKQEIAQADSLPSGGSCGGGSAGGCGCGGAV